MAKQNPEMQSFGSVRVERRAIGVRHRLGTAFAEVKNLRRKRISGADWIRKIRKDLRGGKLTRG